MAAEARLFRVGLFDGWRYRADRRDLRCRRAVRCDDLSRRGSRGRHVRGERRWDCRTRRCYASPDGYPRNPRQSLWGDGRVPAGSTKLVDFLRCCAPGLIFTTSLAPVLAAGALASVRHLRSSSIERDRHQERAATVRQRLLDAGLPVMPSESHIVPVLIGDPKRCKAVSDELLLRFGIYVQPINYPTVPRGTERLRLTPPPLHSDEQIDRLVTALTEIWNRKTARKRLAYGTRSPASDRGDRG